MPITGGGGGITDHGLLTGLADDDHSQYLLLAGRTGGQVIGSTTHSGGTNTSLTIEGKLLVGDNIASRAFSSLGSIDAMAEFASVRTTSANHRAMIGYLDQSASGAASGAYSVLYLFVPSSFGANYTSGSFTVQAINVTMDVTVPSGVTGAVIQGILFSTSPAGAGAITSVIAGDFSCKGSTGAATITSVIGVTAKLHPVASTVTNLIGFQATGQAGTYSGTTSQATAFDIGSTFANSTTVTTWSGLRCSTGLTAAITNKWCLDLTNVSTNMASRIAHPTAIGWTPSGVSSITAKLMLAAGTTAASSAPLKFQSGTSMTTAELGAIEFTDPDIFISITDTTVKRKAFVLDDGTRLTSGRVPFATTNGRLKDDGAFLFSTASGLTLSALNLITDTTTGMKIGTATTQKLGFWNATPIVQPTTAVAAATFTANTSGIVDDSATFDGYTIGQIVKALRNAGLLA